MTMRFVLLLLGGANIG